MTLARARAGLVAAAPALVAAAVTVLCAFAGWRGTDWAAQIYRSDQVARYGLVLWDPGWYGGTYPLNYSLLYPLLAGYLGIWLVAGASAAGAATCFDRLVSGHFGERPLGSWYFAAATLVQVAIGQLPMLTSEALGLAAIVALRQRERGSRKRVRVMTGTGLLLAMMAALASPVGGAFLALALVAWGLSDLRRGLLQLLAGALTLVTAATLPLVFPGAGYFPFDAGDLVAVLVICAVLASPLLRTARPVRLGAVLYGAASLALFVVHTQMGGNDVRFAAYIGTPLLLCYMGRFARHCRDGTGPPGRRLRGAAGWQVGWMYALPAPVLPVLAVAAGACLVAWHWAPVLDAFNGAENGPASTAAYYRPLIREVELLSSGRPTRVEIPPTAHHWESAYVAPVLPLARGWERQLDIAYNPLFYSSGALDATSYHEWLLANGVSYVALPAAPLDYAAVAEASLLRSGTVKGLQLAWHTSGWELWRVSGSTGLASGPAIVTSLGPGSVSAVFSSPGTSVLKVRWSPYWGLTGTGATSACLARSSGGWVRLSSAATGPVTLRLSLLHADHGDCARSAGPGQPTIGLNG